MQTELDKLLTSRPNPAVMPAPIPAMLKSSTEEPQAGKFPDSLWRTLRAFDPLWLALFAIRASEAGGSGAPSGFPQKLVLGACEQGGAETAKAVAAKVSPSLGDWLKASAAKTPLPDVLDRDDLLVECSEAEVTVMLSTYLRMSLPRLALHFAEAKVTRGTADSVAATIVSDCKRIKKELKVPGGRHALAAKLLALVYLGRHTSGMHSVISAEQAALIKRELHLDVADAAAVAAYPLRVAFCATMGHHPDPLHPTVGMQSYYLKNDYVGGSAECMLVNTRMLKAEEAAHFTLASMSQKLSDRLNAPKPAEWESNPAVLYFSDMAPYLIRAACCFESTGLRYRVEPAKLYAILKDVCFSAHP